MLRLLVADDHAIVRQGLKMILSEEFSPLVFGEARNGQELLAQLGKGQWDIVVLDITMPGRSGLDVLKEVKQQYPKLPILVLSMHPEDQFAVRVLKAGASGYLTKENVPEEVVKAIRKVIGGGRYVSASLAEKLAFDLRSDAERPLHEALSDREYQVMCMIASGKTVKEIAEQLVLSIKTISTYRVRILEKLNMRTNAELTHYAVKNRLVD
ncbi:response regulator [Desulfoferrobacter suflitae]|uniref:response regulator n=1 Tax=Desulfoferrobacter suflitae TaxID=2865782 RepID=UPI00216422B7|nr:response regulator transcription factor [Desulfoferrobacter suflitae]MCK8603649.1 response regulator transcription factor [Desulfoferrobacter suflitae]